MKVFNKRIIVFCFSLLYVLQAQAQLSSLIQKESLPKPDVYDAAAVIDSMYGITMYDKLNQSIGGDSVRKLNGRPATGWLEDFYTDGKLLHKGYYLNGDLKYFKNYYPNGTVERDYHQVDDIKSSFTSYYPDGKMKYDADFKDGFEFRSKQYYASGGLEFSEEWDKSGEFIKKREDHYESGALEKLVELKDKKNGIFISREFYESGQLKEEGLLFYNRVRTDFAKDGEWKQYDEKGKLLKIQHYIKGEMNREEVK